MVAPIPNLLTLPGQPVQYLRLNVDNQDRYYQLQRNHTHFYKGWFQGLIAPISFLNIYSGLFHFKVFLTRSFSISCTCFTSS